MVVETKIRIEKIIDTSYLVQLAQCMPIIICHSSSDHFPRSDMVHRTENLRKNKRQPRVTFEGVLTRKLLEQRELQFVYLSSLFSNTLLRRKQTGSKLQTFLYVIISKYYFLNGNHK